MESEVRLCKVPDTERGAVAVMYLLVAYGH